jgi:hypothetical protein
MSGLAPAQYGAKEGQEPSNTMPDTGLDDEISFS